MSFRHHLALFKDHSCLLLPTISRHFPLFPAKKMSQAVVASQYGRRSRGPGRVPRAAPRQPGCTVEQTNHEPRSFLARGASRREFRGFHETRVTKHESRLFFAVGAPGWRHRKPPSGPLRPPASHCFPVHRCSPLFTIVHYCSPLFGKKYCWEPVSPRRPVAASLGAFARHGAASSGYRAACAGGAGGEPVSVPCPPFSVGHAASVAAGQFPMPRTQYEPMLGKGCVPDSVGAKPDSTSTGMESIITGGTCRLCYD